MSKDDTIPLIWGIRAGKNGKAHKLFIEAGVMALSDASMGDLSKLDPTRDAFYEKYRKLHPEETRTGSAGIGGKYFRFAQEVQKGDFIVYPAITDKLVYVGEVMGGYLFDSSSDYPHQRRVRWKYAIPKADFSTPARYELGAARTFFEFKKNAPELLNRIAVSGAEHTLPPRHEGRGEFRNNNLQHVANVSWSPNMPSERYSEHRPLFDQVFANGVDQYVHPTGVEGVKLVVGVEEHNLEPYRISPYGRTAQSGCVSIFLADTEETAKAEVFQSNPPSQYPANSWLLSYRYEGNILNIQQIDNQDFKSLFLQATGDYKHEFSQDMRHYLTEQGMTTGFDSIGWVSVQGEQMGQGGFVYNWISGANPTFEHLNTIRVDGQGM